MDRNLSNEIIELDQYIATANARLQNILTALDWTIEDSLKETTCLLKEQEEEHFHRNDPPLPESFSCSNSVIIDEDQLQSILHNRNVSIPTKFSDIQLNFTRQQKCDLYNYVIDNTTKTSEPELKVSFPNDQTDYAMTFAEIVARAKNKDKKLQRKYRISKPTHIEEVRNLVSLQMQALDKYFNPDIKTEPQTSNYNEHSLPNEESLYDSGRSRNRENSMHRRKKSRSRSTDRNGSSKYNYNRRISHKKEEFLSRRSRSTERINPFLKRKSFEKSIERRKHNYEKRSTSIDEPHSRRKHSYERSESIDEPHSKDKIKKEKTRIKSPKSKKKKHKHHRRHSKHE